MDNPQEKQLSQIEGLWLQGKGYKRIAKELGISIQKSQNVVRSTKNRYARESRYKELSRFAPLQDTEKERSYLAGLIDGEGCFMLNFRHDGKNLTFRPRITITGTEMTQLPLLLKLIKTISLPVYVWSEKRKAINEKDGWVLIVTNVDRCLHWLQAIKPFLIIKWAQAEVFERLIIERAKRANYPSKEFTIREIDLIRKLKLLNKKGKLKSSETKCRVEIIESLKIESGSVGNYWDKPF
jgi:hypothetical protein